MIKMFETWIYGKDGKRAIEKDPYLESCMRNHVFIAAGDVCRLYVRCLYL